MITESMTLPLTSGPAGADDLRWQAVLARDPAHDGAFVFAVRSTGIYCRASCPARRPRRSQVRFYPGPDEAEGAGFRACRRCHPRSPAGDPRPAWVGRICRLIEQNLDDAEAPTLARLSASVGVGPHHLQRTLKRLVGPSPREWAEARPPGRPKARAKDGPGGPRRARAARGGGSPGPSNGRGGRGWGGTRPGRPAGTGGSRKGWGAPPGAGRWVGPAGPTRSPSSSPAIGWGGGDGRLTGYRW